MHALVVFNDAIADRVHGRNFGGKALFQTKNVSSVFAHDRFFDKGFGRGEHEGVLAKAFGQVHAARAFVLGEGFGGANDGAFAGRKGFEHGDLFVLVGGGLVQQFGSKRSRGLARFDQGDLLALFVFDALLGDFRREGHVVGVGVKFGAAGRIDFVDFGVQVADAGEAVVGELERKSHRPKRFRCRGDIGLRRPGG